MTNISQTKKIAIAAVAIFFISISMLIFFLKDFKPQTDEAHTNVLNSNHRNEESLYENVSEEIPLYVEYLNEHYSKDSQESFFVTNPAGEIEYGNTSFCRIVDQSCESLKGHLIFDYINSKDVSALAGVQGELVHDGEPVDGLGPFRMLNGDNELMLLFSAEPIMGDDGKVSFILYKIKDITEQVSELNEEEKNSEEKSDWIEDLYPKADELKDDATRLMVNTNV